jgi:hypothetical protein
LVFHEFPNVHESRNTTSLFLPPHFYPAFWLDLTIPKQIPQIIFQKIF